MAASNTPFPCFKTTGDDKHDIDIYTEDLKDYCVMQNWYDSSKETEAQKWTKPDKAIACLRASLPPAARAIYKYSLGLSDEDQKKPHLVIDALRKFYGASIGVSGERQKFLRLLQEENEPIASWETRVRNQGAQCEYEDFADELMRDQFIAGLRWLDWIFLGGYLPSLSLNYVGMSKDMEKRLPQLYYIKMKISYDLGFIAIGVSMAT